MSDLNSHGRHKEVHTAEGTWHTKTVQLKAESKRRSDCSLDGELESQLHDSSNKIQTAPTATRQLSH